jgi:hypothetical protein
MYDWVKGRPSLLLRTQDLEVWPGGPTMQGQPVLGAPKLEPEPRSFVGMTEFEGSLVLAVFTEALTTAVPLELGGLMLVSASYCDDDASVADHLDLVPISGWQILSRRFVSVGEDYVLFDGGQKGLDMTDPKKEEEILATSGGAIPVQIPPGTYEVETLGPWRPDDRTELYLTRIVRESPSGMTPLGPILG